MGISSEIEIQAEQVIATRMIDYVQSLVVSVVPVNPSFEQPTDDQWYELRGLVKEIFEKLNLTYFVCATASRRKNAASVDAAFEEFHFRAQLYWCNVTGEQYQNHQIQALRELLDPKSDLIFELYGLSARGLCDELQKVWNAHTTGIGDAVEAMDAFRTKSLACLDADLKAGLAVGSDIKQKLQDSIARHGLREEQERAAGLFLGFDLFDLQKVTNLPPAFLEDFSWGPGQDTEFFGEGDFSGWPLRVWPTFKRPFIKIDKRYYCFDQTTLFDHFYRHLEKKIFAIGKDQKQRWIDARKEVTESLPFSYLDRLLPGAICFKAVYYWMSEHGKPASRYETDGILMFDDHLLIIEVKAGAFTHTSPATDVDAHVKSLKALVAAPAQQGHRFLRYLQSAEEVPIFHADGSELLRVRLKDFREVTVCAITLDPFTELAAQAQRLSTIGVEVGVNPIWSLSLDDLRVYADIFTNPLEFLHFVQQRKEAYKSTRLQLDDELDHLGLYLRHNHYAQHAEELAGGGRTDLQFLGYREEIDKFFGARLLGEEVPTPLRQKMPAGMAKLLEILQNGAEAHRSAIAAYVLDMSGEWRDRFFNTLQQEIGRSPDAQPRPFSSHGEVRLTAFPVAQTWGESQWADMVKHAKALLVMHKEPDRVLLELRFDENRDVIDARWQWLRLEEIPFCERPELEALAASLREARVETALLKTSKVGRNEPCPCGSGKKFKKCCLGIARV